MCFSMTGRIMGAGHPAMMEPMGHPMEEEKKPKAKKRKKKKAETPVKKDDKSKVWYTVQCTLYTLNTNSEFDIQLIHHLLDGASI